MKIVHLGIFVGRTWENLGQLGTIGTIGTMGTVGTEFYFVFHPAGILLLFLNDCITVNAAQKQAHE